MTSLPPFPHSTLFPHDSSSVSPIRDLTLQCAAVLHALNQEHDTCDHEWMLKGTVETKMHGPGQQHVAWIFYR